MVLELELLLCPHPALPFAPLGPSCSCTLIRDWSWSWPVSGLPHFKHHLS